MSFSNLFNKTSSNFATIIKYKNKRGEVSNYNIVYNFSYKSLLNNSIKLLTKYKTTDYNEILAKNNILNSMKKRLTSKTPGLQPLVEDGKTINSIKKKGNSLYIEGLLVNKKQISTFQSKKISTAPYDVAHLKLTNMLPISRYRLFKLEDLESIKLDHLLINVK
jgi:hypothetical protein